MSNPNPPPDPKSRLTRAAEMATIAGVFLALIFGIVTIFAWWLPFEPVGRSPLVRQSDTLITRQQEYAPEPSATFPTSTPEPPTASTLSPTFTATPIPPTATIEPTVLQPSFGEPRFCLPSQMDKQARRCKTSQYHFTGNIKQIYVSWTYASVYRGMNFDREWYRNGVLVYVKNGTWNEEYQIDGETEYTYLRAAGVPALGYSEYFPSGTWELKLYIGDPPRLAQSGTFVIER